MKCPYCAEEIKDGAVKCRFCNEFLETTEAQQERYRLAVEKGFNAFLKARRKPKKSPAIAAILNFFFWGGGYLYCGRQWGLAILIPFIIYNTIVIIQTLNMQEHPPIPLFWTLINFIVSAFFACTAYEMAKDDN
jgi:hypothetical protein